MSSHNNLELNNWLKARIASNTTVAYIYADYMLKVCEVATVNTDLIIADPDKESLKTLKALAKTEKLKRFELSIEELSNTHTLNNSWTLLDATVSDVSDWYKKREAFLGQGRGQDISPKTAEQVWHAAGGRCMYRGCGIDLGSTSLTTKPARIAYLAHIVASNPEGPRGNRESHALSNAPENIMLMCDAHHRLIDRIDVLGHSVERLVAMRAEHVERVNYLLSSLCFPRARVITLLADLGHIPTNASEKELIKSVLSRQLSPISTTYSAIRRTQRDDRGRQDFWWHLLHEHENDIRDFILKTSSRLSHNNEALPEKLAIFPLHLVPILVVAERIVGEAQAIELFQYDRNRSTWCWDESAIPSQQGSIAVSPLPTTSCDEVVLSIELTALVDEKKLPENLASGIQNQSIPWIRIKHTSPDHSCICCTLDLEQFTSIARNAIRVIQDELRAKHVHLIGVAPASTLFRFGQLLQAGHHPLYQLYDRASNLDHFKPALAISGTHITADSESGAESFSISLR